MKDYKTLLSLALLPAGITGFIAQIAIKDATVYTSSGMIYTDNEGMTPLVALITAGLMLILMPICDAVTTVRNGHLAEVFTPKAILLSLLFLLCGGMLLFAADTLTSYQTVATIDTDRNSLQFEDHFLSGKTQTSAYSLDNIIGLEWVCSGGEDSYSCTLRIYFPEGEVTSPVAEKSLAQKLSQCTGKYLVESY